MNGNVFSFGGDVRVDVEVEFVLLGQRTGSDYGAVEEVGEPEEIVLFADGPVEVDAAVGVYAARWGAGGVGVYGFWFGGEGWVGGRASLFDGC